MTSTEQVSPTDEQQRRLARITKVDEFLTEAKDSLTITVNGQGDLDAAAHIVSRGIKTPEMLTRANELLVSLRDHLKAHEVTFRRFKDPAVYIGRSIDEANRPTRDLYEDGGKALNRLVTAREDELREEAAVEQRRLQAIEDARVKREQEAEAKRLDAAAKKTTNREEKRELRQAAVETRTEEVVAPTVHVTANLPQVGGQRTAKRWHAALRGKDEEALAASKFEFLQAIVDGHVGDHFIEINWSLLNTEAKNRKEAMNRILPGRAKRLPFPGIEAVCESKKEGSGGGSRRRSA